MDRWQDHHDAVEDEEREGDGDVPVGSRGARSAYHINISQPWILSHPWMTRRIGDIMTNISRVQPSNDSIQLMFILLMSNYPKYGYRYPK